MASIPDHTRLFHERFLGRGRRRASLMTAALLERAKFQAEYVNRSGSLPQVSQDSPNRKQSPKRTRASAERAWLLLCRAD